MCGQPSRKKNSITTSRVFPHCKRAVYIIVAFFFFYLFFLIFLLQYHIDYAQLNGVVFNSGGRDVFSYKYILSLSVDRRVDLRVRARAPCPEPPGRPNRSRYRVSWHAQRVVNFRFFFSIFFSPYFFIFFLYFFSFLFFSRAGPRPRRGPGTPAAPPAKLSFSDRSRCATLNLKFQIKFICAAHVSHLRRPSLSPPYCVIIYHPRVYRPRARLVVSNGITNYKIPSPEVNTFA